MDHPIQGRADPQMMIVSVGFFLLVNVCVVYRDTLKGTNISPYQGMFEDEFPFPKVGYVSFLENNFPPRKKQLDFQLENDD